MTPKTQLALNERAQETVPPGPVQDVEPKFPADDNDFPLGQACDLSGEGTCEACQ